MVSALPRFTLALLLLLAASSADAVELERPSLPQNTWVNLTAEQLIRDERGLVIAEGNVRVTAGTLHLAADRATYDPEARTVEATGRVTVVDGRTVARASKITLDLLGETGILDEVAFFQKEEPQDPAPLLEAEDVAFLRAMGTNEVQLHADRLVRLPDGAFLAYGPSATICDCEGVADWSVGARTARLTDDDRLNLSWPVFYAKGVPVLAAPFFSIPLTNERRSGLLAPNVSLLGRRGPSYEQPLYLVLGHSWDLTFSLGYFFGNSRPARDPEGNLVYDAAGDTIPEEVAFRGPRATLELRWAPRLGSAGRGYVAYGYDQSLVSEQNLAAKRLSAPGTTGYVPHRFAIQLDHADDWGAGLSDHVALNLVSDRNYIRDFTDDIVLRGDQALRSTAWFAARRGQALALVDAKYFQDLRPAFEGDVVPPGFEESVRLFGHGQRDTFARLPGAGLHVARANLPGDVGLSLDVGVARFAPLTVRGFGDWGTDGLGPGDIGYPGPDPDGTEGNGVLDPGELPAAGRLSLRPTLSRPVVVGRFLSVAPFAGWRQELYDYEEDGTGVTGWGVLGASVRTELARRFGAVRHAWLPRLELRHFIRGHDDDGPSTIYDELDARPLRSTTQARVALGTRLDWAEGRSAELAVGQDGRVTPDAEWAESFLEGRLRLGPLSGEAILRVEPWFEELSEAMVRLALRSERGDGLRASYRRLGPQGSQRLRAAPDALFSDPEHFLEVPVALLGGLEQIGAGATVVPFQGLSLSYDLLFLPTLDEAKLLEQRAVIAYTSACRCWGGALHFAKRRDEALSAWVSLHLGEF